jgi:hypothetical protein
MPRSVSRRLRIDCSLFESLSRPALNSGRLPEPASGSPVKITGPRNFSAQVRIEEMDQAQLGKEAFIAMDIVAMPSQLGNRKNSEQRNRPETPIMPTP